jgi:hypothetical protein
MDLATPDTDPHSHEEGGECCTHAEARTCTPDVSAAVVAVTSVTVGCGESVGVAVCSPLGR